MSKYLVLLVAVFAVTAFGYDFKDADFNNYLFEEFQAVHSDDGVSVNARSRREVAELPPPPPAAAAAATEGSKKECSRRDWKKDFQCCTGDSDNTKHHETYLNAKKQCYTELRANNADESIDPFNCEQMQKVKEQMFCMSECVGKKFNFLNEDGSLKRDVILEQVRSLAGDSQWKQAASEGFVDKCLAEVTEKHAKAKESATADQVKGCNRCPMEFHYCIWRELSNGCPAELRVDTPKCNRIRERLSKGDNSFVHKQYLHFLHDRRHEE